MTPSGIEQAKARARAKKAAEAAGWPRRSARRPRAAMRAGGQRLLFDRLFGVDPSVANEDVMGTIPQALFLMNGPLVNDRTQAARARFWARS